MADKNNLNYEVRELKLGSSFTNNKASQYHTIKYDFKPASVDVNKMATVDVGTNHQVTVTVPHLDGAGVPQTVFKGSQRPYTKECVLIIDRVTGEITLEKLSSNIQVKKTRQETLQKPRPLTPVTADFTNTTQRSTSRTRVTTNKRTTVPPPGPAGAPGPAPPARYGAAPAKPPNMVRSPPRVKTSPPQAAPWSGGGNSTLASLPMIGLDEALGPAPACPPAYPPASLRPERNERVERNERSERNERVERNERIERTYVPDRTAPPPDRPVLPPQPTAHIPPAGGAQSQDDSSSSSSSDSGSDSDSASDSDDDSAPQHNAHNGVGNTAALPSALLNDDLCLSSESEYE